MARLPPLHSIPRQPRSPPTARLPAARPAPGHTAAPPGSRASSGPRAACARLLRAARWRLPAQMASRCAAARVAHQPGDRRTCTMHTCAGTLHVGLLVEFLGYQ